MRRKLIDATRDQYGWPSHRGPVRLVVTIEEYGRETRTVWYERSAWTAQTWIWYGPGRAYVPHYWGKP